jgi:phosphoribosyl 1,2-cyclic phosphodiesterase
MTAAILVHLSPDNYSWFGVELPNPIGVKYHIIGAAPL